MLALAGIVALWYATVAGVWYFTGSGTVATITLFAIGASLAWRTVDHRRTSSANRLIKEKDVVGLIDALPHEEFAHQRTGMVRSLGRIGDSRAVEPISTVLRNDPNGPTRAAAAVALGRLRDPDGAPALRSALDDEADYTRKWAIRSIGYLRDRESVERLIEFLADSDAFTRQTAARALGDIGDQRATLTLIELLEDPENRVKRTAAESLAKLGDSRALEPVRMAYEQARFLTRLHIKLALQDLESRFA